MVCLLSLVILGWFTQLKVFAMLHDWSFAEDYTKLLLSQRPIDETSYGYVTQCVHKVARPSLMTQHEKIFVCHPSFA